MLIWLLTIFHVFYIIFYKFYFSLSILLSIGLKSFFRKSLSLLEKSFPHGKVFPFMEKSFPPYGKVFPLLKSLSLMESLSLTEVFPLWKSLTYGKVFPSWKSLSLMKNSLMEVFPEVSSMFLLNLFPHLFLNV